MSYTVNWIAKAISIPTADLTFVSGTRYSLDMADFLAEIRRLEWESTEGLWAPSILDHTNTRIDFAGVNYAPFDDMLNDYTVEFTGVATRVDLLGSNNDIVDILIPSGVSIVPSNSAGLQIVTSGSGVTEQDKLDIADRVMDELVTDHQIENSLSKTLGDAEAIINQIQILVDELHKLQGLDINNPMTVTPNTRIAGNIELDLTGDGSAITVVTRQ